MSAQPTPGDPTTEPPYVQFTPPPTDPAERDRQIIADRARLQQLKEQADEIKSEMDDIKNRLRDVLGVGDHKGAYGLTISETLRFNADHALTVLGRLPQGAQLIAAVSETRISAEKAKALLPPAVYNMCKVAGNATVRL